jgi:DNA repair exonuclease SbcCD ATPase subunit
MTDCIISPLPPLLVPPPLVPLASSSHAEFTPSLFHYQQQEATDSPSLHSSNADVNRMESHIAQSQNSEQEGAHYSMLYEIVLGQNKTLMKETAAFETRFGRLRKVDLQISDKKKQAEKLRLQVAQFHTHNTSLRAEGKLLTRVIPECRDIKKLNLEINKLNNENDSLTADVKSLKKTIAELREKISVGKLTAELEEVRRYNSLLKIQAESLEETIEDIREEARKESVDHGHLEFEITKRDRKLSAFDRIAEARVEAETKLDGAESMIINLQEEIERSYTNFGELQQELDANKRAVASLQQDLRNAEARAGSLQRSLDTAEMDLSLLKVDFENKRQDLKDANEQLELQEYFVDSVSCPIRRRDINFLYRKEGQRSKEAIQAGNRAAHDPNFVADAILCNFECLTERGKDVATRLYGEPLDVHATSLNGLHRLTRRTRFLDWLNSRATIRSWMKEKKHNGTSKWAERFRELDKQMVELNSLIASLHSEEDEFHMAFETDPRVEAKLVELKETAVTEERTRKLSH